MEIACLDLEGVLIPEIWVGLAKRTGIDALRVTTRDIANYDELMRLRISILTEHDLRFTDLEMAVQEMQPLPGALEFLNWARRHFQPVILSDTFYELVGPLMAQLGYPTLLCHRLEVAADGKITSYRLREKDPKRAAVEAFRRMNYRIIAAGDSYNDVSMLQSADVGVMFCPPPKMREEFSKLPVALNYDELAQAFSAASLRKPPANIHDS